MFGDNNEADKLNNPAEGENTSSNEEMSAAQKAEANKPKEEAALDAAAAEASGEDVAGEKQEHETSEEVYFEGRKVISVLPADQQGTSPKGFVRCRMSDATVVDVPRDLFSEGDLKDAEEKSEEASEDKSEDESAS